MAMTRLDSRAARRRNYDAHGLKRSEQRMQAIEDKLRAGMTRNGIVGEAQNRIVLSITSFALYDFRNRTRRFFALLAYASAYLSAITRGFTAGY